MDANQKLRLFTIKETAEYLRMHKGNLYRLLENRKIDMRKAAYVVAVERVAQAMEDRGWIVDKPCLPTEECDEEKY